MRGRHHTPDYKIAVVGSGAVGCYYGGRLANMGRNVHFLMRSDFAHVKKKGLRVYSKQGDFHLQGVKCAETSEEIGACDLVMIAIKSTSNEVLKKLIPPLLKEDTMLLTLQNGLGNEEFLAEQFGAERVLGGLCFVCINRASPGVVKHLAEGLVSLGEYDGYPKPRTHDLHWEFKRSGIVSNVVEDLAAARWKKLVWNIPFNGLSIAAGGITTKEILSDDSLKLLALQLMREVISVAGCLGYEIPISFIDTMIQKTEGMGAYRPSSMIDFIVGRDVEVEAIFGEPFRRGANAGAEVGRLEMIYYLVKSAVEKRNLSN